MLSEPRLEHRPEQPYLSILAKTPVQDIGRVLPPLWDEVFDYLKARSIAPAGAPFWRYRVINMGGIMHVEVGVPVAEPEQGNGRITPGAFPEGRYATAVYTGSYLGDGLMKATAELLEWAEKNSVQWQAWDSEEGHAWASRTEFYLADLDAEPDLDQNQTELAFLTAEG